MKAEAFYILGILMMVISNLYSIPSNIFYLFLGFSLTWIGLILDWKQEQLEEAERELRFKIDSYIIDRLDEIKKNGKKTRNKKR